MTGFEGGFNPKYNSFGVESDAPQAKQEQAPAAEGGVFAQFSPAELKELTSGPLNQVAWLMGNLNHPAVAYLSGDTINAMRAYVATAVKEERAPLSRAIVAGFEEASEREMDEAA